MKTQITPRTLQQAFQYFTDDKTCVEFVSRMKWGEEGKPYCIKCGSDNVIGLSTRPVFKCREKGCKKQFSIKSGTVFENTNVSLTKWLPAFWMIVNDKNGISSCELGRALGISQPCAWFMLHRLREAVHVGFLEKMKGGEFEVDETFVGGKEQFKHKSKTPSSLRNRGQQGKTAVMGIVQRGGEVRAKVVPNTRRNVLEPEILKNVELGSVVYTDSKMSYYKLSEYYQHGWVDHKNDYVIGRAHTNTLENFWSLFKRSVKGTYIQIAPFHIDRYLTEQIFRYNTRKLNDGERFVKALQMIFDKRLTYDKLTEAGKKYEYQKRARLV